MSLDLVGAVLTGVLGGRPKRSRNALRYLGRGGGGFINATTLMTAAGLAWGAYETWQAQTAAKAASGPHVGSGAAGGLRSFSVPVQSPGSPPPTPHVRLLKLAIAAANADGSMSDSERAAVVAQARAEGASDSIVADLERPGALADIVAGVTDPVEKAALYVVAFTVVRADEQVSGSERIFLAQLANLLGLDPQAVASLEKTVAERIDAEGT